jgi:hypothetical protein
MGSRYLFSLLYAFLEPTSPAATTVAPGSTPGPVTGGASVARG